MLNSGIVYHTGNSSASLEGRVVNKLSVGSNSATGGTYFGHVSIGGSDAVSLPEHSPVDCGSAGVVNSSICSGDGSFSGEEGAGGDATPLTGSQKRKARKQTITRHDPLSTANLKGE